jgi:hypothetical protein
MQFTQVKSSVLLNLKNIFKSDLFEISPINIILIKVLWIFWLSKLHTQLTINDKAWRLS